MEHLNDDDLLEKLVKKVDRLKQCEKYLIDLHHDLSEFFITDASNGKTIFSPYKSMDELIALSLKYGFTTLRGEYGEIQKYN
jgi:hypothetical protein